MLDATAGLAAPDVSARLARAGRDAKRRDDVGMSFWAASSLADYSLKGKDAASAVAYGQEAVELVRQAARRDREEPEYERWHASGLERLARAQAAAGDREPAMASLDASLQILAALYQALSSPGRKRDLEEATELAVKLAEGWDMPAGRCVGWRERLKALA